MEFPPLFPPHSGGRPDLLSPTSWGKHKGGNFTHREEIKAPGRTAGGFYSVLVLEKPIYFNSSILRMAEKLADSTR